MADGLFANPLHWIILLVIVMIIFGPGKLPTVGSALGKSIKEFKKASRDEESVGLSAQVPPSSAQRQLSSALPAGLGLPAAAVTCSRCGRESREHATFCSQCGAELEGVAAQEPPREARAPIACSICGAENLSTNRFCVRCGRIVDSEPSRA